jgi:hypothetical protein
MILLMKTPGHATVVTLVQTTPKNKEAVYDAFKDNPNVTVIDKQYITTKLVQIIHSDFTKIAIMSSPAGTDGVMVNVWTH